jgi:hypothetical protein
MNKAQKNNKDNQMKELWAKRKKANENIKKI